MKHTLSYLFFICFLFSCRHDFEKPTWDTDIITPIAFTNLNLSNIVKDSIIQFDTLSDNSLKLIYQKSTIEHLKGLERIANLYFKNGYYFLCPFLDL